jgi:hypothetical protein
MKILVVFGYMVGFLTIPLVCLGFLGGILWQRVVDGFHLVDELRGNMP